MPGAVQVVGTVRRGRAALLRSTALQASACLVLGLPAAAQPAPSARPQGGTVVAGTASIGRTPSATTVNQSSGRAAIDWTSFDVGSGQSVTFNQPSPTAVTLNRVTGPDPSAIAGQIHANGEVIITNPSGVTFYRGAQVDAQSVVVSAAGISNQNFMAGRMAFDQAPQPNARVDNRGTITVKQAGLAALVAPAVANSGVINARLGQVVLAGAAAHTLDMYGDGLVAIDVTQQVRQAPAPGGQTVAALVTNTGLIQADGGVVQLTAAAADGVVQTLVNAGGHVQANTAAGRPGRIEITGTGGSVVVTGRVAADGAAGGQVEVRGSAATTLASGAQVTASGLASGGTVAIGTTLARAAGSGAAPAGTSARTTVAAGARVSADATARGKGGRVTVLSTQQTTMAGALSARGGREGGDGGLVEISGERGFALTGKADTAAPHGALGTVLLDPVDLTVVSNGGTTTAAPGPGDPNIPYSTTSGAATVREADIEGLNANVHLQATNNLTVDAPLSLGAHNLTLEAGNNLTVTSGSVITTTGLISLTAAAASSPAPVAGGVLSIAGVLNGGTVVLNSGAGGVSVSGQVNVTSGGVITVVSDSLTLNSNDGSSTLSAPSGTIVLAPRTAGLAVDLYVQGDAPTGALSVSADGLATMNASTLQLGQLQGGVGTAGDVTIFGGRGSTGAALDLGAAGFTQLVVESQGAFTQSIPLAVTQLSGQAASLALTDESNFISTLAGFTTTTGSLLFHTGQTLLVTGPVVANGSAADVDLSSAAAMEGGVGMTLQANITAGRTVTLNSSSGTLSDSGGISQTGGVITAATLTGAGYSAALNNNNVVTQLSDFSTYQGLSLNTTGPLAVTGALSVGTLTLNAAGISQTAGSTITAFELAGTSSAGVALNSAGNVIQSVGAFTVSAGDLSLVSANSSLDFGHGVVKATTGSLTFIANTVGLVESPSSAVPILAPAGTVTFAPLTASRPIELVASTPTSGALSLSTRFLSGVSAQTLQIGNAASTGAINIGNPSDTIDLTTSVGALVLSTAGAVTQGSSAILRVGTLSGSAGSLALPGADITTLGAFTATNGLALGNTPLAPSTVLTVAGPVVAGTSFSVSNQGPVALTGSVTAPSITIAAHSTTNALASFPDNTDGTITQSGGTLSGTTISLTAGDTLTQTAGSILASGTGSAVSLASGGPITLGGTLSGGTVTVAATTRTIPVDYGEQSSTALGTITQTAGALSATGTLSLSSQGPIALAGAVTGATISLAAADQTYTSYAGASPASVTSPGTISQTTGSITAGTLTGTATALSLSSTTNAITALGAFTTTEDLLVTNGQALSLPANVTVGGNVTLKTTAGGLTIGGLLTGGVGTFSIAGDISGTGGGSIALGTLTGSAGSLNLTQGNNALATLGSFTTATGFDLSLGVGLSPANALLVSGIVKDAAAITVLNYGPVTLTGSLAAPVVSVTAGSTSNIGGEAQTMPINLDGTITQTGGSITGGTISLTAGYSLTQTAGSVAGTGQVKFASSGPMVLGGANSGAGVAATATGQVFYLDGSRSVRANTLGTIAQSGTVSATGTASLSSQGPLTLAGAVSGGTVTLSAADLAYTDVNGAAATSPGTVTQTGGAITAGTLGGAADSFDLQRSGNSITSLGTLTATGALQLTDASGLTVAGSVSAGDTVLTVTSGGVDVTGGLAVNNLTLAVAGAVASTTGGSVSVGGTLTGTAGSVSITTPAAITSVGDFTSTSGFALAASGSLALTGTLSDATAVTVSSVGPMAFSGAVAAPTITASTADGVQSLGSITQTGGSLTATTSLQVSASDALSQTAGTITAGTGAVALSSFGPLSIGGAVSGGTVSLVAADKGQTSGTVLETGSGSITAGTLSGSAGGSATLLSSDNAITSIGGFSSGFGFALSQAGALSVAGPLADGTSISLTSGALTLSGAVSAPIVSLTSTGAITQPGGSLQTGALSGSAAGAAFGQRGNSVAVLDGFSSSAGFTLTDAAPLSLAGALSAGTGQALTLASDALTFATGGSLSAPGGTVALQEFTPGAGITLSGGSGLRTTPPITATSLSIGTGTGGPVTITAAFDLSDVTSLNLLSAGAVSETGVGALTVATLTGSSATASLGGANHIGTLGGFTTTGAFALVDDQALTVTGPLVAASATLQAQAGTLVLAGNVTAPTSLALDAPGAISQNAGAIVTGALTGSAGGTAAFTQPGNAIGTVNFASNAGFTLAQTGSLSVLGLTDPVSIGLTTGALALNGTVSTGALSLSASGAVTQPGGSIQATTLSGSAGTAAFGQTGNRVGAFGPFGATGDLQLADAAVLTINGTVSVGAGHTLTLTDDSFAFATGGSLSAPGGTVALQGLTPGVGVTLAGGSAGSGAPSVTATTLAIGSLAGGPVTLTGALDLSTVSALDLLSAGAITETGAGALTVGTLEGSGASAALNGANLIGTLGGFTTSGAFSLANGQTLTVAGPLAAAAANLQVTGGLTLAGTVTVPGSLTLGVTGAVAQTSGAAVVGALAGSSGGAVALTQPGNAVASVTFASNGGFALVQAGSLTVTGLTDPVSIALSTGALTLNGTVSTGSLLLTASGAVTQPGGAVQATTLDGSAASLSLGQTGNAVGTLGTFSSTGGFALTQAGPLTVAGTLTDTSAVTLATGALTLAGVVTTPSLTLTTAGAIIETGGVVQAATLGGSATSVALGGANLVGTLSGFTASGAFSLTNTQALAVSGPLSASTASVSVAGALALSGPISAPGGLSLAAATINQPGGTIATSVLSGSATGTTTLSAAGNSIAALGDFTGGGAFTLADSGALALTGLIMAPSLALTVTGALTQPSGSLALGTFAANATELSLGGANQVAALGTVAATGAVSFNDLQALALSGDITAPTALALTVAGAISQTGGAITTGVLSGSATAADFSSAGNSIASLGPFSTTGNFTLQDGRGLTVAGPVDPNTVTLNVVGDLTLNSTITAGAVSLTATGAITEGTGGGISAGQLTITAGSAALGGSNAVGALAGATTQTGFTLVDGVALAVDGAVSDGVQIGLQTAGALSLAAQLTAPSISLVATGISQTAGAVAAGTLSGAATGAVSLTAANAIGTLASFSSQGGFALTTTGGLIVTGPLSDPSAITLTSGTLALNGVVTTSVLTLDVAGAVTQPGGSLQVGTLAGTAGSLSLAQAGNSIGTLAGFASSGDFTLSDPTAVTITAALSAGAGGTLTLSDDAPTFAVGSSLSAPGGTVVLQEYTPGRGVTLAGGGSLGAALPVTAATLVVGSATGGPVTIAAPFDLSAVTVLDLLSGGAVSETGNGAVRVPSLAGNAGTASLTGSNAIGTLAGFTTGGSFSLANAQALTVTGPVAASSAALSVAGDLTFAGSVTAPGGLAVAVTGAVTQSAGTLSVGALSGTAGSAVLNGANAVTALGPFTATGAFSLADAGALTVAGAVNGSSVSLASGTALTLAASVTGASVTLAAGGTLTETAGTIQTASLSGSANSVDLEAANGITALASFNAPSGLALTDTQPLAVTGPVSAGPLSLSAPGVTLAGAVDAASLTVATPGSLVQTAGTVALGSLAGSAGGSISLGQSGSASVQGLGALAAGTAITVTSNSALASSGALSAPNLALTGTGAVTLGGGTVTTNNATIRVVAGADGASRIDQTGVTAVLGRATLQLVLPAAGGTVSLAALVAPATNVTLSLGSGSATGMLSAGQLLVLGSGGSVTLTGSVGGDLGFQAAQVSAIQPGLDLAYQLNGCAISAVSCGATVQSFLSPGNILASIASAASDASVVRPDIVALSVLDLSVTRDRDDPTLQLPNISDRDY